MSLDDFRHEALTDVGSTNTECLERARKGALSGLWVTAVRQTGGRGRRGRAWFSEPGNLYASLLLIDAAGGVTQAIPVCSTDDSFAAVAARSAKQNRYRPAGIRDRTMRSAAFLPYSYSP